jgi:hypothetical protein
MSGFIALAANAFVYSGYRLLKKRRSGQRNRELKIAFAKY